MTQPQIQGGKPIPQEKSKKGDYVRIPDELAGIIVWLAYSVMMFVLLLPFLWGWQIVTGALLLGHFSAQVNSLKKKK